MDIAIILCCYKEAKDMAIRICSGLYNIEEMDMVNHIVYFHISKLPDSYIEGLVKICDIYDEIDKTNKTINDNKEMIKDSQEIIDSILKFLPKTITNFSFIFGHVNVFIII